MNNALLLIFAIGLATLATSQVHYKSYDSNSEIYYENILHFDGKPIKVLHEHSKKYLLVNGYDIRYEDENEIYATGRFETKYRGWFLIFFNTKEFNCLYDLKINFKDNKIKYNGSNYVLIDKYITINAASWYSNPMAIGNLGWSTTQIPTEVPKRDVNLYFKEKKTKKKHLLFQDLDVKMTIFEQRLTEMIMENEDDW